MLLEILFIVRKSLKLLFSWVCKPGTAILYLSIVLTAVMPFSSYSAGGSRINTQAVNSDFHKDNLKRLVTSYFSQYSTEEQEQIFNNFLRVLKNSSIHQKASELLSYIETMPLPLDEKAPVIQKLILHPSPFRLISHTMPSEILQYLTNKYSAELALRVLRQQTEYLFKLTMDVFLQMDRFLDSLNSQKLSEEILTNSLSYNQLFISDQVQRMIHQFIRMIRRQLPDVKDSLIKNLLAEDIKLDSASRYTYEFLSLSSDDVSEIDRQLTTKLAKKDPELIKVVENFIARTPQIFFDSKFNFDLKLQALIYIYENKRQRFGENLEALKTQHIFELLRGRTIINKAIAARIEKNTEGLVIELKKYFYPSPIKVTPIQMADLRTYAVYINPEQFWAFVNYMTEQYKTYIENVIKQNSQNKAYVSSIGENSSTLAQNLTRLFIIKNYKKFSNKKVYKTALLNLFETMEYLENRLGKPAAAKILIEHFSLLLKTNTTEIKSKRLEIAQSENIGAEKINLMMIQDFAAFINPPSNKTAPSPVGWCTQIYR